MKKLSTLCIILILSVCFFPTCKKDNGTAPVLPPQESFTIDFSNFTGLKKSVESISDQKGTNNSAWEFASLVAGYWRIISTTTLAVPIASFKLAVDNDPVFLENSTWQWSYSVSPLDVIYKARLTGQITGSEVLWKMYITREGTNGFPEFVWFEGNSKLDGTGGQWVLNQSSLVPEAVLQIDWTKTGTKMGTIKYTCVKNLDPFKTSSIEYGLTTSALNANYKVHYYDSNLLRFSDVLVEWNTSIKNGRVKSTDYLDGKWFCWDENKLNNTINCPQ